MRSQARGRAARFAPAIVGRETGHRDAGAGGTRVVSGGFVRLLARWVTVAVLLVSLPVVADPAGAAQRAVTTRVTVSASPATVHVRAALVVSGAVFPRTGAPVVLQRLVGPSWVRVADASVTAPSGKFTFTVRAPAKAAGWVLRVTRAASATAKAGVSGLLHVRVVTAVYVVKAVAVTPVAAGSPVVVTGSVAPKATGTVVLQLIVGKTWIDVASAKLSATSTFRFATARPVGGYRIRVLKAFSAKVAGGLSKLVSVAVIAPPVTVTPPPAAPSVTTSSLPPGTVGTGYSATLTATGGTLPYLWTSSGLPAGLTLSTTGVISGIPTTIGASPVTVAVGDSAGRTGTAALTVTVGAAPRPAGRLWAWGEDTSGQLGNNSTTNSDVLVPVSGLTDVTAVAGGRTAGYAVRSDGTVWAWGYNDDGELGDNSRADSHVPVQVAGLTSVTAVAGGQSSGYALRSDGTVWAWGYNAGSLGDGLTDESDVPVQVSGLTSVTAIAASFRSGYALRADGTVWAWGFNTDGELGNNSTTSTDVPVQVSGLTSVTAISAGYSSGYALSSDGTVWAWGFNTDGELGNSSTIGSDIPVQVSGLTSVTAIAGGQGSAYALRSDGTVWAWGYNGYGELGNNSTTSSDVPVQVSGLTSVTAITGGGFFGFALRSDGYVWAWGDNAEGELGNGSPTNSDIPVQTSGLTGVIDIGSGSYSSSGYAIEAG